jgi:hypothetical protein
MTATRVLVSSTRIYSPSYLVQIHLVRCNYCRVIAVNNPLVLRPLLISLSDRVCGSLRTQTFDYAFEYPSLLI